MNNSSIPAIKAIGAHIYYYPLEHIALLQKYGVPINANASKVDIAKATTEMLSYNHPEYVNELTQLVVAKENRESRFLPFLENLFGGDGDGDIPKSSSGNSLGGGGFDPVTAVANAVGSIFGFLTAGAQAKSNKEKAQAEMVQTMAGIEMEKQKRKTQQTLVMILASVAIIGLATWAAVKIKTSKQVSK